MFVVVNNFPETLVVIGKSSALEFLEGLVVFATNALRLSAHSQILLN